MRSSYDPTPQPDYMEGTPWPAGAIHQTAPLPTVGSNARARLRTERRRTELGLCVGGAVASVLILGTLLVQAAGRSTASNAAAVPARPTTGTTQQASLLPAATSTAVALAPVATLVPSDATASALRVATTATTVPDRTASIGGTAAGTPGASGTARPSATAAAGAAVNPVTTVVSPPNTTPAAALATMTPAGSVQAAGAGGLVTTAATPSSGTPRPGTVVSTQVAGAQATPRTTVASGATPGRTPSAGATSVATPAGASGMRQAPAATPGATVATSSSGQRKHTVQGGDTLLALAVRYRTTVEALVTANNLNTPETMLSIGQTLVLP